VVDLSPYKVLHVGEVKISDSSYPERSRVAERELRQVLYTRSMEKLWRKFEQITAGEEAPGEKALVLSADFYEYKPYRAGTQGVMVGLFGPFGLMAGKAHMAAVIRLADGGTGKPLAEIPFHYEGSFVSNQLILEELAQGIAQYIGRCKVDEPVPLIEVSWGRG
jgi:hypothetical protein